MALEVNAQYVRFVQFAQQQDDAANSKAIARVSGEDGALDGRTITAATNDKVAPWTRRSQVKKDANNIARELFRQSIIDMFGGEDRIPESVKDAMLMKDYGRPGRPSGKPLTARRIMAVKAAVDVFLGRVPPALKQAQLNAAHLYNPPLHDPAPDARRGTVDTLLDALVRATATDKDALDVAVACAGLVLRRGNSELVSPAEVQAKAANILAAVTELRNAANGDQAAFKAGKDFIIAMGGKAIPEGFLSDMLDASKRLKMTAMKGLSASSSGPAIHNAVCEFFDNIEKATNAAGVETKIDGADELIAARDFAAALMLARCGEKTARNIVSALSGSKAGVLNAYYLKVELEEFKKQGLSRGLVRHASFQGARLRQMIGVLSYAAQGRLGVAPGNVVAIPDVNNPDYRTINRQEIFSSILQRGRAEATRQKNKLAQKAVAGQGELADKLRGLYLRFGGPEVYEPDNKLTARRNNIILSMLNGSICEECKKLAGSNTEGSQFVKDLNRNETVKLPGNQMLDNHSLDGARDQLASFVTNGAKTTYASLGDVEKGKVRVLMAILNQKTVINVLLTGEPLVLDPDGRAAQIQYGVAGERRWEFSVAFKQDGTLTVTCKSVIDNLANMIIPGENGEEDYYVENINPATKIETAFNVEIAADEFSRLASLDYSKCDPEAVNRMIADPNVKDPHTKYGQALGEEFAFKTDDFNSKVKCTSSWKITVA